jgi:hypothetical protein
MVNGMNHRRAGVGTFAPLLMGALALWTAACGSGSAASGTAAPSASSATTPPVTDAAEGLDFTAPRLGGGELRGTDYLGRDLALWFWAPY